MSVPPDELRVRHVDAQLEIRRRVQDLPNLALGMDQLCRVKVIDDRRALVSADLAQLLSRRGEAVNFLGRGRTIPGPVRRHDHEGVRADGGRELDAPAVDFKNHRVVNEVPALPADARHRQPGLLGNGGHPLGGAKPVERLPDLPAIPAGLFEFTEHACQVRRGPVVERVIGEC